VSARARSALLALALAALTAAVYWPAEKGEFVAIDDPWYVSANPDVARGLDARSALWALTTFHAANWHPLTWLSHLLDVELYALDPRGHHRTSVLLHAANAALAFLALRAMSAALWPSALVAALFALHPLRVESVAWVAERKDVLSGLFAFLALLAWSGWARRGRRAAYVCALIAFALGLLAKPMLVTLPLVLLLLDVWPFARLDLDAPLRPGPGGARAPLARLVAEKLPFFALALGSAAITMAAQAAGGAVQEFDAYPLAPRLANAVAAIPEYLSKMLWPTSLAAFYPYPSHWNLEEALLGLGVLFGVSFLAWRRRRAQPYLLVGWLWFLVMLLPVIGLVQVGYQRIADRYTYLPGVGVLIAVTWLACDAVRGRGAAAIGLAGGALLANAALVFVTVRQIDTWRDTETLYRHALAVTEENWLAHARIGRLHRMRGDTASAVEHLRETLRLRPDHARARYDLADSLHQSGQLDEAQREFEELIRQMPFRPAGYVGAARVARERGDLAGAVRLFGRALRVAPDNEAAYKGLRSALREVRRRQATAASPPPELALLRAPDRVEWYADPDPHREEAPPPALEFGKD
jgi:tetratricopeptide (TPR) repeat protein